MMIDDFNLKKFITENKDLINNNDFDALYKKLEIDDPEDCYYEEIVPLEILTDFLLLKAKINVMDHFKDSIPAHFSSYLDLPVLKIPNNIKNIGFSAFGSCLSKEIFLPSSLQTIEGEAFLGAERVKHITIPKSVVYIGDNAFNGSSLTSVTIENKNILIGSGDLLSHPFTDCRIKS